MSSIYLSDQLKARLIRAARRRGFVVELGRQSQLAEYIAYLVRLDEQAGRAARPRRTLDQALGLLERPGQRPPTEADIHDLLSERRMRK
jgi:hypothetical protein